MNIKELNEELENLIGTKDEAMAIIRELIAEENTAVASYIEKAKKVEELGYPEFSKVLLDISNEELVHIGELNTLLEMEDMSNEDEMESGREEVEEKLGEE